MKAHLFHNSGSEGTASVSTEDDDFEMAQYLQFPLKNFVFKVTSETISQA